MSPHHANPPVVNGSYPLSLHPEGFSPQRPHMLAPEKCQIP
jgi:hypothetical protein